MNTLTAEKERTEKQAALGLMENGVSAQSHNGQAEQVYCQTHGFVKSYNGHCETCVDEGYRDWDATRVAKTLIPDWTGISVDGRQVIVAPVRDALEAVQAISRYKNSDALVLIVWDNLVTALDRDRIGPNWVLPQTDADEVECAICCQPFRPTMGDETICDECYLHENGPRW